MKQKQSIWQEFCYDLIEARKNDVLEYQYQDIVESNLRQLGWSKVRGEICPKERINVGSHNQIEPDITIKISNQPVFVIELKRPNNVISSRQEQQLLSYMRLRKISFGLYIGNEIRLYYDTNDDLPTMVWRTEITLDAKGGEDFVDYFSHDTFNRQRIEDLCWSKAKEIKSDQIMADFKRALSSNQDTTIKQILKDYFVEMKRCDKNIVDGILNGLCFSVMPNNQSSNNSVLPNMQTSGIIVSRKSTQKSNRDTTKYSLDGGKNYFGKGKFVREIVAHFIKQNPSLTYNQLVQVFPDNLQGSYGVLRTIRDISDSSHDGKDLKTRYVMADDLILTSSDGIRFVVSNQWGKYNFTNILELLKKWNWYIISTNEKKKS